ncbi:MAG: MoaD/ThiS family protein [Euryarchaeota archaeon]|nr:MoaD/ThiS family protein [Euryarchaeota archaeon]
MMVQIHVKLFPQGEQTLELPEGTTYDQAMEKLGFNPETVVVFRGENPVPGDEKVEEGEVRVLRVVSGG